jgi:hypothetical protein
MPRVLRLTTELGIGSIALILLLWALLANQEWFDRHFLPAFFVSRNTVVTIQSAGRVGAATIGLLLLFVVRPRAGRAMGRNPWLIVNTLTAVLLAFSVSELVLSRLHTSAAEQEPIGQEPRRRIDARLGWTFVPSRMARHLEQGRMIEYAFDSAGYRVRRLEEPVDPDLPSILFTGESMVVGEGLTWEESIPAQVGGMLGMQSANLGVSAYATDQAYMRLQAELPRFRRPVAVVGMFTPALFDRNMDSDRPHLGPGLVWSPPVKRWRLLEILTLLVRYRKVSTIERGIAVTREVLRASTELARSRGATPLILVPQFAPETPEERALRERIFEGSGLPLMRVELDGRWRIPGDGHPDARAARAIADAIANRLMQNAADESSSEKHFLQPKP